MGIRKNLPAANKTEILNALMKRMNISFPQKAEHVDVETGKITQLNEKEVVWKVVTTFFKEVLPDILFKEGKRVKIPMGGVLHPRLNKPRKGYNFHTNEVIDVKPKRGMFFKPSRKVVARYEN